MLRKCIPIALASLMLIATAVANAAPAGFAEGVRAYGARQYRQALSYFTQAAAAAPSDPMVHYYMGLSYQGMNQMTLAKQQYEWVSSCRANPALAGQARLALQNISKYQPNWQSSSPVGAPRIASTRGGGAPTAEGIQKASGRLQVLDFYTDW